MLQCMLCTRDIGRVGARGASAPPNVVICQNLDKEVSTFFQQD